MICKMDIQSYHFSSSLEKIKVCGKLEKDVLLQQDNVPPYSHDLASFFFPNINRQVAEEIESDITICTLVFLNK